MTCKILCIQLKQIGDCLMTTPAVRALALAMPEAEIHYLTMRPSDQLFLENGHVTKIHLYPKEESPRSLWKLISQLRAEKFEISIDFFGLPKTAILSRLIGAKKRIGYNYRGRAPFYTHAFTSPDRHPYAPFKKLELLEVLGIQSDDPQLEFPVSLKDQSYATELLGSLSRQPERPLISISPVSRQKYKVWPAQNFAFLADRMMEEFQAQILFLWGPGEEHFIAAVRSHMQGKDLGDYEIPTIAETKAILEQVTLHLGNDNGPMHFAIAAQTPSLAIFGRPMMENWTPPNSSRHRALEHDPGCKGKCNYPHCGLECLVDLTPERVWESLKKQLTKIID